MIIRRQILPTYCNVKVEKNGKKTDIHVLTDLSSLVYIITKQFDFTLEINLNTLYYLAPRL